MQHPKNPPVAVGDKIVIDRWEDMHLTVMDVSWHAQSDRWLIIVAWPHDHGLSRVWGDDEDKGWKHVDRQTSKAMN